MLCAGLARTTGGNGHSMRRPLAMSLLYSASALRQFGMPVLPSHIVQRRSPPPALALPVTCAWAPVLGGAVAAGARAVERLPQIWKCVCARSVDGLSAGACYGDTAVYLSRVVYHSRRAYPLSSWGEVFSAANRVGCRAPPLTELRSSPWEGSPCGC